MPPSTRPYFTTAHSFVGRTILVVLSAQSPRDAQRCPAVHLCPSYVSRRMKRVPSRRAVIPSAARLMTSLRDIGYDLPSAVADLIDNCIDAGATTADVQVCREGGWSFIRISDNGHGMTERVLDEAMRYVSRRSYRGRELGKFGLGLKTAS